MAQRRLTPGLKALCEALGIDPIIVIGLDGSDDVEHKNYQKHATFCCMDDATAYEAMGDTKGAGESFAGSFMKALFQCQKEVVHPDMPFCGHDAQVLSLAGFTAGMVNIARLLGVSAYVTAYGTTQDHPGDMQEATDRCHEYVDAVTHGFADAFMDGVREAALAEGGDTVKHLMKCMDEDYVKADNHINFERMAAAALTLRAVAPVAMPAKSEG